MSKILGFLAQNKSDRPFEIRNKGAKEADIILYDQIGFDWWTGGGVTLKSFDAELKKLPDTVTTLNVRINSPGGDVFDGVGIYNRLKQHKAKKIVHIDGLAASIASIIALAGDEIIMGEGALYMIHLPWTGTVGDRTAHDNTINRLLDVEEQLIGIYARRTKLERSEIKSMLEKETWLNGDDAKEFGFIDSLSAESLPIAASAMDKTWIHRAPKAFKSETAVIENTVEQLKKKIEGRLARK